MWDNIWNKKYSKIRYKDILWNVQNLHLQLTVIFDIFYSKTDFHTKAGCVLWNAGICCAECKAGSYDANAYIAYTTRTHRARKREKEKHTHIHTFSHTLYTPLKFAKTQPGKANTQNGLGG